MSGVRYSFSLYLIKQFPSAAFWYHLVSTVFELVDLAVAPRCTGSGSGFPITPGEMPGSSGESRQLLSVEIRRELINLRICVFVPTLTAQRRSQIVKFLGKCNAVFVQHELECLFLAMDLRGLSGL